MRRLAAILYSLLSTMLASSFVVLVLVNGGQSLRPLLLAAGAGFVLAAPLAWGIARRIAGDD